MDLAIRVQPVTGGRRALEDARLIARALKRNSRNIGPASKPLTLVWWKSDVAGALHPGPALRQPGMISHSRRPDPGAGGSFATNGQASRAQAISG